VIITKVNAKVKEKIFLRKQMRMQKQKILFLFAESG